MAPAATVWPTSGARIGSIGGMDSKTVLAAVSAYTRPHRSGGLVPHADEIVGFVEADRHHVDAQEVGGVEPRA